MHSVHMSYQYGVPINESRLCRVFVFLADTPKSAEKKRQNMRKSEGRKRAAIIKTFILGNKYQEE